MKRQAKIDLAVYTRQMKRQSIWCGMVFALTVVMTVLNVLPPVDVYYEVSGKILVEPSRVKGLVSNLRSSTDAGRAVRLKDFQVLDRSDFNHASFNSYHDALPGNAALNSTTLVLLNVQSIWPQRSTVQEFHAWAESITRPAVPSMQETDLAKSIRMARWELSAARHYASHHEFIAASGTDRPAGLSTEPSPEGDTFRLVSSTPSGASGIHAGQGRPAAIEDGSPNSKSSDATDDSAELVLEAKVAANVAANVTQAAAKLADLERQLDKSMAQSMGKVEMTDSLKVKPLARKIPLWMAISVIILGVASAASTGWLQWRLQSGGVYDPDEVAEQLASRGIPIVSHITLPTDQAESSDWLERASHQASGAGRRTARHMILLSESSLAVWTLLIAGRFVMDPAWRSMLFDSPLAAFGRLLAGLP